MNSKVVNVLILLATNSLCANCDIVSSVKSSTSTIANWYDYYIKPLWPWTTTYNTPQLSASPDADVSFYENNDIYYNSPSIQDDGNDVVLMDLNEDQVHFV